LSTVQIRPGFFSFDHGIESIVRGSDDAQGIPQAEISPAFLPLKPQLEQLFEMPNLGDYMKGEVAPEIRRSALLLPYRFRQATRDARNLVLAAAEQKPEHAEVFLRAAGVLDRQDQLLEQAREYVMALVKG
jgi:hypothetical protein